MTQALAPVLYQECGPDGARYATVTLNRPAARNSLVWDSWARLDEILEQVAHQKAMRCVVLFGGHFFSSGGDIKSRPGRGIGPVAPAARLERAQGVLTQIRSLPVPVIAAVEGAAIGLGWSLVLACDLAVAARDAYFSAPFVSRGIVPDGGAGWLLTQRVGRQRASELLFTGAKVTAEQAASFGLVNRVCEPGSAYDTAAKVAQDLAQTDPAALEMTKRLLDRSESMTLADYFTLELAAATITQLGHPEL